MHMVVQLICQFNDPAQTHLSSNQFQTLFGISYLSIDFFKIIYHLIGSKCVTYFPNCIHSIQEKIYIFLTIGMLCYAISQFTGT